MLTVGGRHIALNRTDGQAQRQINRAHPFHVAARKVVVDGNDVNALPVERVQVRGERGDERFTFARHHFGNFALVQGYAADELYVVVAQPGRAAAGFAANGKRLFQNIVERFSGG